MSAKLEIDNVVYHLHNYNSLASEMTSYQKFLPMIAVDSQGNTYDIKFTEVSDVDDQEVLLINIEKSKEPY